MLAYLLKRFGLALLTLLIIMLISYSLIRLAPGDPSKGSIMGGAGAEGLSAEKGDLAKNLSLRKKLHLDEPVIVGFFYWLEGFLLRGELGESASFDKGRPVAGIIMERLPITLRLNLSAILLTYLLAIPIGIYSATHPGARLDKFLTFVLFLLYSLPSFWIALLLQASICEGGVLPIFPLKGLSAGNSWGVSTWRLMWTTATHYFLPVFCLSYMSFAALSRYARTSMLEVIKKDYIKTARAKGLSERVVIMKHAFRNALIVLITLFAGLIPRLVAGSIFVEYVFSIPGMGSLSMTALTRRDIPLLMALFAITGALTLIGILLADIMYVVADPRISFEGRR